MNAELKQKLIDIVGEENYTEELIDLVSYSFDASEHMHRPEAGIWPRSTEQVQKVLALCNQNGVPVTPRGAGTGLAGSALPFKGGLVMDLCRMNKILDIQLENRQVRVQAGVVYGDLQKALAPLGFFYPPDPASGKAATLGGNVATNAGGLKGAKYGVTKNYVLGMDVVLANGSLLKTGSNCMKCVSGYDMTGLFVGSEGTLGVVTEVTLKILPEPKEKATAMATFPELSQAGAAIAAIMQAKATPCVLEIMDEFCIKLLNKHSEVKLPEAEAMLLVETDSFTAGEADQQIEVIIGVMKDCGAKEITKAESRDQAEKLWTARRSMGGVFTAVKGAFMAEDVTVPPNQINNLLQGIHKISEKHDIIIATLGHVGDGNLHPNLLFDKTDPEESKRAHAATGDLFQLCIDLGGTLTGEHGIGLAKAPYFPLEHDATSIGAMSAIKMALDPNNILNPGKMALQTG
jgi:glycolate oxidase